MAISKIGFFAVLGLLVVGSIAPASAGSLSSAKSTLAVGDVSSLQLVTDRRGSWIQSKSRFKSGRGFNNHRGYSRYSDGHRHGNHFKKKSSKKFYKRGFRKGYSRGFDRGYSDGRRGSRFDRHRHRRSSNFKFRGGFGFGNGHFNGGNFSFRY